jgi:uncharacterized protein DUF3298/peptidoglycan-N-acetylmuramic acid deacetylase PdaC-like protein
MKKLFYSLSIIVFLVNWAFGQEMNVTFKEIKEKNKKKNYTIDISYPQVDFGKDALMGMRGVAADINNTIDTFISHQVNQFKSTVAETNFKMKDATNELDIKSSVLNKTNSLLSILFENFTYIVGSAHPSTTYESLNYGINGPGVLKIADLFKKNFGYLKVISDYSIKSLKEQQTKMGVNIDSGWIETGAGPDTNNFKAFNIKDDSLILTFNAYQVAPYYVGSQTVIIPLNEMKDILDPKGPLAHILK